ncbi:ABC transporter permease [Allomuricauda sp. SCSIO 65647]|uniref:ABC transporter permease n=1 Tax=Allomuricauda sp. SCSIO 65647 TaxID=2908843 RepID=UPI001F444A94|nr:ABC transporter permease [Muricauda sp. SCSIO 65647]UJH69162.1 ABC transporter permease [Muricauda sp. SCSIO 65647]
MLKNYLKIAWRNLWKNRIYSVVNVGGLAVGMAVALMIGLWVVDELTHDQYFGNKDQIAQVYQNRTRNGSINTGNAVPRPLEFVLREQYADHFKHIVMASWEWKQSLAYNDNIISRMGNYMQAGITDMLDLKMVNGQKDGLQDIDGIMLDKSTSQALFGSEDPIGKVVRVNNEIDATVTGVYEDIPFNNSFHGLQFLIPWERYLAWREWVSEARDSWNNNSFQMLVQIADNMEMDEVTAIIKNVKKDQLPEAQSNPQLFLFPMKDWYLRNNFEEGRQAGGRITYVKLFGIIGILVLVLACINFMNLGTARSEKRAKEVGLRKTIGSNRGHLVHQFLGESFLITLLAFFFAVILVLVFLGSFNELSGKEVQLPWKSPLFWMASMLFICITALLSGSYPALYLSSFKPAEALKGTFKVGRFSVLPRKALVVIQFTASAAFIIGTLVVLQQIRFVKNRPVGYDKEGLIQIPAAGQEFSEKRELIRNEFLASGAITEMSTSSAPATEIWSNAGNYTWDGKPDDFQVSLAWTFVSPEYAKSLGLKVIMGRDFSREFPTDSNAVLINKAAMKYMGLSNPIGKYLRNSDTDSPDPPLKIIGVVEDMIVQSPFEPVRQGVYAFDKYGITNFYNLRLNPQKSTEENLEMVENVFKEHFSKVPFDYQFVDNQYAIKFQSEERVASLAGIFTVLAIFISCLGLFGLTAFVAERRTKEIGVRKVLGASVFGLWKMLSKDFLALVLIACTVAIPIAFYIMKGWLQNYTYRIDLSWAIFAAAILGALFITFITVSFQAIKAANANPVKSLRTE